MLKKLLLALVLSVSAIPAFAACTNPLSIKDGAAATVTMSVITGADTFCVYNFNTAMINGVVPLMGNGATGTGSPRVTIANDNTIPTGWPTAANQTAASAARGQGATGAAVPSGAQYGGMNVGGNLTGVAGLSAGADGISNTTTQLLTGGFGYFYNGTTWDRFRGDTTNGLWVNVKNTLTAVTPGDGITTTVYGTAPASPVIGVPLLWNGTTYDRQKSAGATGVAAVGGSAAEGAAPAGNPVNLGAKTSGATGGLMQGLIQCDSTAIYDASTSGSTELVALTSGRTIYVCGYSITWGGTTNVKLVYGTGTNCATSPSNMTPAYQGVAQFGIVDKSVFWSGLKTASANALCINASGAVAVQAIVYYAKL